MTEMAVGVGCGVCGGGPLYFETCPVSGHDWALASECQNCGERHLTGTCQEPGCDERAVR